MNGILDVAKANGHAAAETVTQAVDNYFQGQTSWQVASRTALACVAATYGVMTIRQFVREGDESASRRIKKKLFAIVRSLPYLKQEIQKQVSRAKMDLRQSLFNLEPGMEYQLALPEEGLSVDQIMERIHSYSKLGIGEHDAKKLSGQLYYYDEQLQELAGKVFTYHSYSNPLHADVFQDIRKIEAEVVRMVCTMFHGDSDTSGVVTMGGSESLLLAVLAARNRAYEKGIRYPEIIMPVTAHASIDKACFYFRVRLNRIAVDQKTFEPNMRAFKRAITHNTCLLIGSAPGYPYGVVDQIEEISQLGLKYKIPVHVDACLGGFVIAFLEASGVTIPRFDFRLPGVSSISCDTHKYGYAPKGTSTLLFRNSDYMKHIYFSQPDWPGGIYATPTTSGSRSGAVIATAWAAMMHFGRSGYEKAALGIADTTQRLADGISKIPGLEVLGNPFICAVGWTSKEFDIIRQFELLKKRAWLLGVLQFPSGIHITITQQHCGAEWLKSLLDDIRETTEECLREPDLKAEGEAAMYGMAQSIPDRSIVQDITFALYDKYYTTK